MSDAHRRPRSRDETPFRWHASCGMPVYAALAGVPVHRIFYEADAIVEAFTVGEPKARALFGPDVGYGGPGWHGISYGHVNCLGSPLRFPENSQVAHAPIYASLDEGIVALQRKVDWANAGLMPFYLDLWARLKTAFPDRQIPFGGFGHEGPITTAWEVRGHGFFLDVYDDRERYQTFLSLLTDSIVEYCGFIRSLNGQPAFVESGASLYDDVASLIHPALWPELVLPYQEQYLSAQTSGRRHAHIENLVPDHLPYLDVLRLDSFDPSVSPRLQPGDLRERCRVPFEWRLNGMQVRDLTRAEIRRFVFDSIAEGASGTFVAIAETMLDAESVGKVHTFIEAARQVEQLLSGGCPRSRLGEYIS